ncbi:hypothetical protein BDZ45DRAFT_361571 [Acephala macrosclerotiorum]|nr:hypothetical protein BDZ45DRAFT_361571 [Acephala macrosclerotiorum]
MCPKDSKSKWENVGCKRGNFHPPSFRLCRRPFAKLSENQLEVQVIDTKISSLKLGSRIDPRTQKDSADANLDASPALPVQDQFGEVHIRQQFYQYLDSTIAERSPAASAQLLPLEQCALAILWNFIECPMARQILNDGGSLDDLTRLLPFAIAYQAELQEDQLIAQSLICLRTCAEALRVKAAGLLGTCWHSSCGSQNCKIECVANLSMHLGLYTQELSRVFFKKENVHHRGPWFLSTFYSFCIQSYVRRVLVELTKDAEKKGGPDPGFDACIAYEEAIWQIGRRDKATDDAPILLDATYPLFCDGLEYEYPVKHKTFFGMAAEKWKGLSPVKRESSLRQALLVSVEYLRVKLIPYTQAQNPLKCSQSVFGPMLKRSRLSPDMIADLIPKVPAVAKEAEPDQYLYFPVRLFIALNSGTLDPLCGLFDRNSEFGALRVHIEAARRAVAQPSWDAQGIRTSSDYLKALFQDDGRNLDQHLLVGEQMHDEESMPQPCDANREGRCSVCMNHVHTNEDITFLPCLHWFHESCVVAWLQEINTCPSCRTVIYQEPGSSSTKRKRSPTLTSQQDEAFSRPLTVDDSTPGPRMLSSNSSGTPPSRPRLQCWEHGCNGRMFSTFSNLFRHKREMSRAPKEEMPSLHRNA